MTTRIAINGFGRIGRNILRAYVENKAWEKGLEIVAINDLAPLPTNAHLLKYDTVHGRFAGTVTVDGDTMTVNGRAIKVLSVAKPEQLPWKDMNIDIVFECSGRFTDKEDAALHLKAGAKKVLVSAPSVGADLTVVYGVNHDKINASQEIISNASCTTNCLAPVAAVLHKAVGIDVGFMTTIHSFTGDQRLVDTFHSDAYRARAAAQNLIPTSTGAAKAVGLVLPELKGKLDGTAIRVPTPNVSLVDLKFTASRATTVEEINSAIVAASTGYLAGILAAVNEPLVSSDFNHDAHSSTFDLTQTKVLEGRFVRVMAWYDNEWGFSCRMLDTAGVMAKMLGKSSAASKAA